MSIKRWENIPTLFIVLGVDVDKTNVYEGDILTKQITQNTISYRALVTKISYNIDSEVLGEYVISRSSTREYVSAIGSISESITGIAFVNGLITINFSSSSNYRLRLFKI